MVFIMRKIWHYYLLHICGILKMASTRGGFGAAHQENREVAYEVFNRNYDSKCAKWVV
jgi:hypothetical protein